MTIQPEYLHLFRNFIDSNDSFFNINQENPTKYQKVFGKIQMVIRVNHVNLGKKASFKFNLVEANYIPTKRAAPQRRLGTNTADSDQDIPDPVELTTKEVKPPVEPASDYDPDADGSAEGEEPRRQPEFKMIKSKKTGKEIKCVKNKAGKWVPCKN